MIDGFVDLQVNGARGVDFTSTDLTSGMVDEVAGRLRERGVVAFCPTVITTSVEVYAHCLPVLAHHADSPGHAKNLGIHLEGPFLNPQDGPRGVHPKDCVQAPSIETFERLREWADDRIALVTLAPEVHSAIELIEHIARHSRTVVSIGHTNASADDIHRAADAGARLATHIGNGLLDRLHRHHNPIWPMLADDRLGGMFITDGFHLPDDLIRVGLRAKSPERSIVTSDMVHISGLAPGEYDFHGAAVVLKKNGHLHRKGAEQLAGSACDMLDCMNYLASLELLTEEELCDVGCRNALKAIGAEMEVQRGEAGRRLEFDGKRFWVL